MRDALVVGAGPAGCIAAILLAGRGWAVTLVEQHRFPRDKVCGECLSPLGIDVLNWLNLGRAVRSAGAVPLTRTVLHAPDGRRASLRLPRENWGISRSRLDALLLNATRAAGVRVRQPARCEKIDPGHPPAVRLRDLLTNRVETLAPSLVLLADGKSALLPTRPPPTRDFGIKAHFAAVAGPRDAVELFGVKGHYGGVAPIESADETGDAAGREPRWNVAFSVPAARLESFGGDLDSLFAALQGESRPLAQQFSNARRLGPWLVSPLPRFAVRRDWPAGVYPVGNAAAALEPVGGEGMGLAMRSAELTATALADAAECGRAVNPAVLVRSFDSLWRARRLACRLTAQAISRPAVAGNVIGMLNRAEIVARAAMRWIGKDQRPHSALGTSGV